MPKRPLRRKRNGAAAVEWARENLHFGEPAIDDLPTILRQLSQDWFSALTRALIMVMVDRRDTASVGVTLRPDTA